MKSYKSHSWFIVVKKVLVKYNLPDLETLLENPDEKLTWKRDFNTAINNYWNNQVMSQSRLYSSLKYLSKTYTVGKCHSAVLPCLNSDRDILRIPVKNKVLPGIYILQTNRATVKSELMYTPLCTSCARHVHFV